MKKKTVKLEKKQPFVSFGMFMTIVATLLLRVFVVQGYGTPTGSMENTIMAGDIMLVNKFIYGAETPKYLPFTDIRIPHFRLPAVRRPERGDVVVFDWPGMRDEVVPSKRMDYLKRCVGLPGDTIRVIDRVLYVNESLFPNPPKEKFEFPGIIPKGYPNPGIFPDGSPFNEDNYGPVIVPKRGDIIRLDASNFRRWKIFVEREGHVCRLDGGRVYIDGKARTGYTVEDDYYFMMGDNRENSLDSRFWGFVPYRSIVGRAMIVYWSWDPDIPLYDIFSKLGSIRWDRIGIIVN